MRWTSSWSGTDTGASSEPAPELNPEWIWLFTDGLDPKRPSMQRQAGGRLPKWEPWRTQRTSRVYSWDGVRGLLSCEAANSTSWSASVGHVPWASLYTDDCQQGSPMGHPGRVSEQLISTNSAHEISPGVGLILP